LRERQLRSCHDKGEHLTALFCVWRCTQFAAACAHVVGTPLPLSHLPTLTDAAALQKARFPHRVTHTASTPLSDAAARAHTCSSCNMYACTQPQYFKPTPEELKCGSLADAVICRVAAKEVL
jgi:hypothetical protein